MIEHELICTLRDRIKEFYFVHGGTAMREMFNALGVDEDVAAHYFKHAQEIAPKRLDVGSFGYGLLFGLLTLAEFDPPTLNEDDLAKLAELESGAIDWAGWVDQRR